MYAAQHDDDAYRSGAQSQLVAPLSEVPDDPAERLARRRERRRAAQQADSRSDTQIGARRRPEPMTFDRAHVEVPPIEEVPNPFAPPGESAYPGASGVTRVTRRSDRGRVDESHRDKAWPDEGAWHRDDERGSDTARPAWRDEGASYRGREPGSDTARPAWGGFTLVPPEPEPRPAASFGSATPAWTMEEPPPRRAERPQRAEMSWRVESPQTIERPRRAEMPLPETPLGSQARAWDDADDEEPIRVGRRERSTERRQEAVLRPDPEDVQVAAPSTAPRRARKATYDVEPEPAWEARRAVFTEEDYYDTGGISGASSRRAAVISGLRAIPQMMASGVEALLARGRSLLVVLLAALIAYMLFAPVRNLYVAKRRLATLQETCEALAAENDSIRGELEALQTREGIEDEARARGYVTLGETKVIVDGLPEELTNPDDATKAVADIEVSDTRPWYVVVLDTVFGYEPGD